MKKHLPLAFIFFVGVAVQTVVGQSPYGSAFDRYTNFWNRQNYNTGDSPYAYAAPSSHGGYASQVTYPPSLNSGDIPANWRRWSPNQAAYQANYGNVYGNPGYGTAYGAGGYRPTGYPAVPANYAPQLDSQNNNYRYEGGCRGGACHGGGGRCGTPNDPYRQAPYQGAAGGGYGSRTLPSNQYVDDDLWGQSKLFARDQPVRNSLRYLFP